MSDTPPEHSHDPGWCEIRLKGHLGPRWAARFDGMTLTTRVDGTTLIEGPVVDQAALHGLLRALRDLGLPLLSVTTRRGNDRHGHSTRPSSDGLDEEDRARRGRVLPDHLSAW